jgi:hypothetical protein
MPVYVYSEPLTKINLFYFSSQPLLVLVKCLQGKPIGLENVSGFERKLSIQCPENAGGPECANNGFNGFQPFRAATWKSVIGKHGSGA